MQVGLLTVRVRLHSPQSLKEKRSLLKGWIAHFHQSYNLSVAEVGQQDDKRAATLALAQVANDRSFVHHVLSKIAHEFERLPECSVEEVHLEVWP